MPSDMHNRVPVVEANGKVGNKVVQKKVEYVAPQSTYLWRAAVVGGPLAAPGNLSIESGNFTPNPKKVEVKRGQIQFLFRGLRLFGS